MALDATGTPTSPDSIPKYNTAVDPPSGKGFNAAMDAIQAALSARSPKPVSNGVKVWNGTTWVDPSGTADGTKFLRDDGSWQAAAGPGDPVTTLPGSPSDKQQALLVDSLTAPTYAWVFQYEAGISDAYKWVFIGGSDMEHALDAAVYPNSTTYVDGATVVTLTTPRAGIYDVLTSVLMEVNSSTQTFATPKIGAAAAVDADGAQVYNIGGALRQQTFADRVRRKTLAASDVVKLQYKQSVAEASPNGGIYYRSLRLRPLRVS